MKILLAIACVIFGLWAIIALAVALAPYMFGLVAFLAALWLIFWVGTVVLTALGVLVASSRDGRR